ncbi:hypothetical protein RhiJN_10046 [Ceratobasidium sp. AG-Ba]|nr:hypothetical protein RhiJN_10046 [Ceratobasidium sp. AG-Ba]
MQSGSYSSYNSSSTGSEEFPPIDEILFRLDTTIYDIGIQYNNFELTMMKNVAGGTYKGGRVIMMQISGTASRAAKQKAFKDNLKFCVTSSNLGGKNIARFIGGKDPSYLSDSPFALFDDNEGVDHEEFLRLNKSPKALFKFLEGAQEGARFIYSKNIKHRDCIKVSPSGDPVVYPSGLLRSNFSGRNSTKRAVRHFLRDVGTLNPVLPLQGIYELLSAATASQAKAIERTLIDAEPESLNDLTLWRLADTLQLPLTRELHYYGPIPDFTFSVGDIGKITPAPSGRILSEANTLIQFRSWRQRRKALEGLTKWEKHLCTRAMRLQVVTPYFLDGIFQPNPDVSDDWVR